MVEATCVSLAAESPSDPLSSSKTSSRSLSAVIPDDLLTQGWVDAIPALVDVSMESPRKTAVKAKELTVKLYVGNLPWSVSNDELEEMFGKVGTVETANVVVDRDTGRSRGFGFVEMSQGYAQRAISDLNGHTVDGRQLRVNEAQSKPQQRARY